MNILILTVSIQTAQQDLILLLISYNSMHSIKKNTLFTKVAS